MYPLDEPLFPTHQHAPAQQQYWARWEYSPEDWNHFERLDWTSAWHAFWRLIVLWLLVSVVISADLVIVLNSTMHGLAPTDTPNAFEVEVFLVVFFIAVLASVGSSCIFLWGWLPAQEARQRHRARQVGPHRVTIGPVTVFSQSFWLAGQHFPLQDASVTLTRVTLSAEPPALHFRRRHGRTLTTRTSGWYDTVRILLPSGHEQEVELLLQRFRQETMLASKQKSVPAEPL
jgi:hypothetical protein